MQSERDPAPVGGPRRNLTVLVRLQRLDRERDSNQRLVDRTDDIIAARASQLDEARVAVQKAQNDLRESRMKADSAEVDLKAQDEEVRRLGLQLNTAKTNQEYQALQTHISKVKAQSAREEENTLVLYEEIEAMEVRLQKAEAHLKEMQGEFEQFVAVCERDRESAREELAGTDERRQALLSELPQDLRASYERVREAREGVAVVPCEDRTCTGCGVSVSPNDIARMKGMSQIVHCDSCQRVLYVAEALQAEPEG